MKKAATSLFLLVGALVFRASAIQYTTDLPVKLGEWTWNFAEAKQIADEQHIPMVLFWGGASCSICANVEYALEQEEAVAWQKKRNLVMVFQSGTEGAMKELVKNSSGTYPYICVYWNKGNGVTTTNRFSGVVSGPSRWPATGTTTVEHFINSVEMFIADYQPAEGNSGTFITGTTAGNQLEAEVRITERLLVPLSRNTASQPFVATNYVVAAYPAGTKVPVSTNLVEWAAGEAEKLVAIELPYTNDLIRAEDSIALTLLNDKGLVVDETNAMFVEPQENSPKNPRWIGERTAETLEWGEWTMDIDVATNKVAAAEGAAWTLVGIFGSLWCSDCFNVDKYFLPDPAVTNWAANNHVTFVAADIPNIPQTAPALLSYQTNYVRGIKAFASGAGYISRHGINAGDAAACLARNYYYAQKLFYRPEDTNKYRTNVPIFVLLNKKGEMVGRFTRLGRTSSPKDSSHNVAYLRRLSEMIEMAGDADEMGNNHATTTSSSMAGQGGTFEGRISHADALDTVELTGLNAGAEVTVAASAGSVDRNVDVKLSILEMDAAGKVTSLVSQTGLLDGLAVTGALQKVGVRWFAQIFAAGETATTGPFAAENEGNTITPYALSVANMVFIPNETVALNVAAVGSTAVKVRLAEGETYRFAGLAATGWEEALEVVDAEQKLYTARLAGDAELPVAEAGGTLTYQQWHPGEVAFADGDLTLEEKAGLVEVSVVRTNGVSGAVSAGVTADLSQIAAGRLAIGQCDASGVFTPGEPTLEWAEGEDGVRTFWLKVLDDFVKDGDQTLTLTLTGESAVDGERAQKKITILEDDKSGAGMLAITSAKPAIIRNSTVYAPAGTEVEFEVSRLEAADGEVGAMLTASVKGDVVEGLLSTNELVWCDKSRGAENVKSVRLAIPSDLAVGGTVAVSLGSATGGATLDPGAKKFTVSVISPDSVKFVASSAEWNGLTKVYIAESVGVEKPVEDAVVMIRKLSGSLPGGVKAAYDKTEGVLKFSGTPNRAGTFTAVYQAEATISGVALAGEVFVATFTIRDIVEEFPVFGGTGTSAAKARTFRDVYLVEDQTKRVAGLVTLTIPASGKMSAKYVCSEGTISFSCTGWRTWDREEGTLWALLTSRSPKYAEYWMYVTQHADGKVEVEVHDSRFPTVYLVRTLTEGDLWSSADNAHDWRGTYTLAMPVLAYKPASDYDIAYKAAAAGVPTFSLRMVTRSAINAGRFIWSGYLPNGKAISGSAVLNRADDVSGVLPIFFRNSSELFASLVTVEGGHADAYASDDPAVKAGGPNKFGLRAITAAGNALNWWEHTDTRSGDLSFAWTYDAYGSFFVEGESFSDCLVASGVSDEVEFTTNLDELPDSEIYGAAGGAEPVAMKVSGQDFAFDSGSVKLAVNRRTGMVSGKVALPFEAGEVKANFRGVALPGWTGCGCHGEEIDLPLVMGACWFTDKVLYTDASTKKAKWLSVRRGCEVTCETKVELGE